MRGFGLGFGFHRGSEAASSLATYIAFEGSSTMAGEGASSGATQMPQVLEGLCATPPVWDNVAEPGANLQGMAGDIIDTTGPLIANAASPKRVACLYAGGNDIAAGRTTVQVSGDLDTWIAGVRAAVPGVVIAIVTQNYRTDLSAAEKVVWHEFNSYIRSGADADVVIDLASESRLHDPADTAFFTGDGVHMNDAGHAVFAEVTHKALASVGQLNGPYTSFDADAVSLIARMSAAPDATRQGHINALITTLKGASVWTQLDALHVLAAHDSQSARLNWKRDAYNYTVSGTPVFTADRGYVGAASSYLDSGFNQSTATRPKLLRDYHHAGVWRHTVDDVTSAELGGDQISIGHGAGLSFATRSANGTAGAVVVTNTPGHYALARASSTGYERYRLGAALASVTQASAALTSQVFFALGRNNGAGTMTASSVKRVASTHWGGHLTAAEMGALNAGLQAYMTAVGAG